MAARRTKDKHPLGSFDGREVIKATVAITRAGDGLSAALAVDPQALDLGDKVYVVLECEVGKVSFEPVKDTQHLARVHTLRTQGATLVDEDLVRKHLDEMQVRIEEAQGVSRLPMGEDGEGQEGDGSE